MTIPSWWHYNASSSTRRNLSGVCAAAGGVAGEAVGGAVEGALADTVAGLDDVVGSIGDFFFGASGP